MKNRLVLLAAILASTCCLASLAHATNTNGQGGNGDHGTTQSSSQSSDSTHVYGDTTDAGQSSSVLTPGHQSGSDTHAGSNCDASGGMNPHMTGCGSNHGGSTDSSSDSPGSSLGWQSLLPGSIQ
jgi:hypothetical protein